MDFVSQCQCEHRVRLTRRSLRTSTVFAGCSSPVPRVRANHPSSSDHPRIVGRERHGASLTVRLEGHALPKRGSFTATTAFRKFPGYIQGQGGPRDGTLWRRLLTHEIVAPSRLERTDMLPVPRVFTRRIPNPFALLPRVDPRRVHGGRSEGRRSGDRLPPKRRLAPTSTPSSKLTTPGMPRRSPVC